MERRSGRPRAHTASEERRFAWDHPVVTAHDDWNGGWQSVRDSRYRYIQYMKSGEEELYDMDSDPYGWHNLSNDPDHAAAKKRFRNLVPAKMATLGSWKNGN